jgi:hypothetical protein
MFDASQLYPNGYHPQSINRTCDRTGPARHYTRTQRPPKYYLIDFGISRKYDSSSGPPLEAPILGGDKTVPEFQKSTEPCDPFPTDVYYVGNLIRTDFLEVRVQHLQPAHDPQVTSCRAMASTGEVNLASNFYRSWFQIWFKMIPPSDLQWTKWWNGLRPFEKVLAAGSSAHESSLGRTFLSHCIEPSVTGFVVLASL